MFYAHIVPMSTFWRVYHKWVLNIVKSFFFASIEMIVCVVFFIIQFPNIVYHTDQFADLEKILHLWDKSCLIRVYDTLDVSLGWFCWYFIEDF